MDHLDTIFARNCRVERIPKPEAAAFLDANHRLVKEGTLAAVAVFSNARRWEK